MTISRIREVCQARLFKPFTIRAGGGRDYAVRHPEFLAITPSGRTIVVTHGQDSVEMIDLLLVESIHFDNGRERRQRGRSS